LAEHQSVDTFQTERLVAVRLRDEHFDEILRMHRDPKVMATLGGLRADDETARYLRDNLDYGTGTGTGSGRSATGRTAGSQGAGLRNIRVGGNHEVELAYAFVAEYWNRGLAAEMAEAILGVAFEKFGLTDGVCFTLRTTGRRGGSWRRRSSDTSATSPTRASRTCSTASPL
jgi:[ribosomal protein S5]-alanine N-acetyltransferase